MRILVAEDDVRLAALLEESLTEAGWQADVVHDGRSAYDRLLDRRRVRRARCSTGCCPGWTA